VETFGNGEGTCLDVLVPDDNAMLSGGTPKRHYNTKFLHLLARLRGIPIKRSTQFHRVKLRVMKVCVTNE
jgi:hypothetical protein